MDIVNNFSQNLPGLELSGLVSIIGALALASLRVGSFFLSIDTLRAALHK